MRSSEWKGTERVEATGSAILSPMLGVSNLGKRYGPRWLFRNLEFELEKGDCLVVLGANGSGKSTLLKVLIGLVEPTDGRVDAQATIGYSALDLSVYPALTAREHLELSGDLRDIPADADALLAKVGLTKAANQMAQEFSTGMRARLKIAIALQAKPQVLILDEPGAGLDEVGRNLISEVVSDQLKIGAVVLATNDPNERRIATFELEISS